MIDKELFRLIGGNRKYVFVAVALQVVGLAANVAVTAGICLAISLLYNGAESAAFVFPVIFFTIRYIKKIIARKTIKT